MEFVREGDVLYITKLYRLAKSIIDLHNTAKVLEKKMFISKYYIKTLIQHLQQVDCYLQC